MTSEEIEELKEKVGRIGCMEACINAAEGNIDNGLLFCGANAYRSTKMEYVKDIMQEFSE